MKKHNIYAYMMVGVLVSFLGFCFEDLWLAVSQQYMDNRNMGLPFLLGYGLAILAIFALFGTPRELRFLKWKMNVSRLWVRRLIYFFIAAACVTVGELVLGNFVEMTSGFAWWDYRMIPLHITRYTALPTSAVFGGMILLFMDFLFIPIYRFFCRWNPVVLRIVAVGMSLILLADYSYHMVLMYIEGHGARRWRINLLARSAAKLLRRTIV